MGTIVTQFTAEAMEAPRIGTCSRSQPPGPQPCAYHQVAQPLRKGSVTFSISALPPSEGYSIVTWTLSLGPKMATACGCRPQEGRNPPLLGARQLHASSGPTRFVDLSRTAVARERTLLTAPRLCSGMGYTELGGGSSEGKWGAWRCGGYQLT